MTSDDHQPGDRLREARKYLGLSQKELADHVGLPRSTLTKMELGQRRIAAEELRDLARALRRPVSYFLDEDPVPTSGSETAKALFRAAEQLTERDQAEVLRFVQFLRDAGPPPDGGQRARRDE